jgi:hypothetical protein
MGFHEEKIPNMFFVLAEKRCMVPNVLDRALSSSKIIPKRWNTICWKVYFSTNQCPARSFIIR